ncbi:hypothetical protein [Bradyrhizobium sp. F1.13.3]|uniref:hypothetical protein n=1 Tax=Bradyrhizobium sp. F1.13.3 TaxID=3156351 RepID=UPI00339995D9
MSTIMRRRREIRTLNPWRRHELLIGEVRLSSSYEGYTDGHNTRLLDFIGPEMRRDWADNRADLLEFWRSGRYTTPDIFPNSLPWLFARARPGRLLWAYEHLD